MAPELTKSNLDFIQIACGYLSMRIKDVKRMGEADDTDGDEEPTGGERHAGDEETSSDENQYGNDKKKGEGKKHALAWTQVVEEMRDLDRKLSQCDVALEAAERDGLMGARDKWGWERK
ncbi:MAG: hypothetical protein Q9198_000746 [Flavoplaca austrocitrina]